MAILRSISGEFYEVPDKQLDKFLVPDDRVKEKLDEANLPLPSGPAEGPSPPGSYSGFAPVVVQFLTPPQAMGFCGPQPAPQGAVDPYGFQIDWGCSPWGGGHWGGGHGGGHWGGGHGGGHWGGGHGGGHWGGGHGGGHWGGGHGGHHGW